MHGAWHECIKHAWIFRTAKRLTQAQLATYQAKVINFLQNFYDTYDIFREKMMNTFEDRSMVNLDLLILFQGRRFVKRVVLLPIVIQIYPMQYYKVSS